MVEKSYWTKQGCRMNKNMLNTIGVEKGIKNSTESNYNGEVANMLKR